MSVEEIKTGSQVPAETSAQTPATGMDTTPNQAQTPAVPASDSQSKPSLPSFIQDPEAKKYMDSYLSKQERKWQQRMEEQSREYTSKLEAMTQRAFQPQQTAQQDPNQKAALEQLADMLFGNPDLLKKYGLDISDVRSRLDQMGQGASEYQMDSELEQVSKQYGERFGMSAEEVKNELLEAMESDPLYGNRAYTKGIINSIAKSHFFDRSDELATRAANQRLLQEQELKKKAGTQPTQKVGGSGGSGKLTEQEFWDKRAPEILKESGKSLF